MSGLTDLSGIALRAYAPTAKQAQTTQRQSDARDEGRPVKSPPVDRRLAPAFSIELSFAAQKALGEFGAGAQGIEQAQERPQVQSSATSFEQLVNGVGRREGPMIDTPQRNVAIGSQLNIEI